MRGDVFLYAAAFIMDLCGGLAFFSTPLLGLRLGASVIDLGLMGTLGGLAYILACPMMGRLADRHDRSRMIGLACLFTAAAYLLVVFIDRVALLLVCVPLMWVGMALFWPALQAALAEGRNRTQLVKALGTYNIVWSLGFMNGPLLGGPLYAVHPRLPFIVASIGMVLLGGAILVWRPAVRRDSPPLEELPADRELGPARPQYRVVAWIASFTAFFTLGIVNNLFPKLAMTLAISPTALGRLLAVPRLAQILTFLLVRHSHRWQYRLLPLAVPQACTAVGLVFIATADTPLILGIALSALGVLVGTAFYASQFYSLFQEERKGERGAFNEVMVGMGNVSGPFLGGVLAQAFGLRAPYVFCCGIVIAGLIVEYRLARSS